MMMALARGILKSDVLAARPIRCLPSSEGQACCFGAVLSAAAAGLCAILTHSSYLLELS